MKHLICVLFLGTVLISCKKTTVSEKTPILVEEIGTYIIPGDPCPPGTYGVWTYEFDGFNFKRPKFSCGSGFWFCFKNGHWVKTCVSSDPNAHTNTNSTVVWGKFVGNQFELHFPTDLVNKQGNSPGDFQTFSADDDYEIATGLTLAKGVYQVNIVGSEFVILVNIL